MNRVVLARAVGALVLVGCGGSDEAGTLTVREIASATKDAPTYRFTTHIRGREGVVVMPYTGQVDGRTASVVVKQPGSPGHWDLMIDDDRLYNRAVSPDVSVAYDWCEQQDVELTEGYAGVRPYDTLSNLDAEGRSLREVGAERVRDTETVHYEIEGADPPVDVWVDDEDRLRRLIWTHEGSDTTDTVELYDFGAPIEITIPGDAPPCPEIPRGFEGSCILGNSYEQLPKCPDDVETP